MDPSSELAAAETELQELEGRLKTLLEDYDDESRDAQDHGSPLAIAKARRDELASRVQGLRAGRPGQSS